MTETRICEFDHNNNPKKIFRITKDEFSGLPCSGVEDGLPYFGVKDDKGGILEDGFAEKGKKKRRICETGRLGDPLVVLGSDIMLMILSCLDARSVAQCLLVSCGWRVVASSDNIWSSKCEELWQGKSHLPRMAKVNELSKLAVYSLSVMDGKRKRIRKEDLYDHVWEFHFTEDAPEYWRMLDPYWNGTGRPLRRYFLPDGSQTAEPDDRIWGGHESCYSIVTSLLADGKIRQHYVRINRWPPMYVTRKIGAGRFLTTFVPTGAYQMLIKKMEQDLCLHFTKPLLLLQ